MTNIYVVGENWCDFTEGTDAKKGAWLQMEDHGATMCAKTNTTTEGRENCKTTAQGATKDSDDKTINRITYQKVDCGATDKTDAETKLCTAARGYPSFMDSDGNTCTRGFNPEGGFGKADGTEDGITKTIQGVLTAEGKCPT